MWPCHYKGIYVCLDCSLTYSRVSAHIHLTVKIDGWIDARHAVYIPLFWTIFHPSPSLSSTQAEHSTELVSPGSLMAITVASYLSLSLFFVCAHKQAAKFSLSPAFVCHRCQPGQGWSHLSFGLCFSRSHFPAEKLLLCFVSSHHRNGIYSLQLGSI